MMTFFAIIALVSLAFIAYLATKTPKYDGELVFTIKEDGTKLFILETFKSPEEIEDSDVIIFKVVQAFASSYSQE